MPALLLGQCWYPKEDWGLGFRVVTFFQVLEGWAAPGASTNLMWQARHVLKLVSSHAQALVEMPPERVQPDPAQSCDQRNPKEGRL